MPRLVTHKLGAEMECGQIDAPCGQRKERYEQG
jgi:hypothetical protein